MKEKNAETIGTNKTRVLCTADMHGGHKALVQVLQRSNFNYEEDTLICLGDVADGWEDVPQCFDELLKVKHLVYVLGNHDEWLCEYLKFGLTPQIWLSQGGRATCDAYQQVDQPTKDKHLELLTNAPFYYVLNTDSGTKVFIHGGFNWKKPIEETSNSDLMWDRHLWSTAVYWNHSFRPSGKMPKVQQYDEVFIGHTSTSYEYPSLEPVHMSNVWNLDQGGGGCGKLTIMDVSTHEYWQSDKLCDLYDYVHWRK